MRRSAICLCASLIITPMLAGCSLFQKKTDTQAADSSTDMYATSSTGQPATDESAGAYDPYGGYGSSTTAEPAYETTTLGPRYHTVVKKDTLYSLARTYYNDQRRWKDIYNANRAEVSDPNKIYVGQRLLVP
jgi:nucleoid-associated protein YgaU